MPFYTFRCGKCPNSLEILTTSADREDRMCPKCQCAMRRQFPKPARPGSKDGSWKFKKEKPK